MELKQIKELMTAMERAGIKKLSIKEKTGFELQLERHEETVPHQPAVVAHYPSPIHHPGEHHHSPFPQAPQSAHRHMEKAEMHSHGKNEEKVDGKFVVSPMVGTLYASPSPEDPPFVKVGDRVEENTVVCIIEAMKVMNEVKAGVAGVVAEIYVENAHPVEFGTKIFRIV